MASEWKRGLPNLLTLARLALALAFFILLSLYRYPATQGWALDAAIACFLLGVVTDAIDGHLARRWNATSVFGRVMDPLCDKILVIGALVMLAGPAFAWFDLADPLRPQRVQVSGIEPWMVLLVLLRELLVTGLRSLAESQGIGFSASWSGKLKMILQSAVVPIVLLLVGHFDPLEHGWSAWLRDALVWTMVAATVISGAPYVLRAAPLMRT